MVDVVVTADSERYDITSPTWLAQVADLRAELMRAPTGFRVDATSVPGTKGTVDTVILALTSASTLSAATACFRGWLNRDKSRTISVSWTVDDREEHVSITADAMDGEATRELMRALGRRIAREQGAE